MRNIEKNIEQGHEIIKKHERADLRATELLHFAELCDRVEAKQGHGNGFYEAIRSAFLMGVAVGARNS